MFHEENNLGVRGEGQGKSAGCSGTVRTWYLVMKLFHVEQFDLILGYEFNVFAFFARLRLRLGFPRESGFGGRP